MTGFEATESWLQHETLDSLKVSKLWILSHKMNEDITASFDDSFDDSK